MEMDARTLADYLPDDVRATIAAAEAGLRNEPAAENGKARTERVGNAARPGVYAGQKGEKPRAIPAKGEESPTGKVIYLSERMRAGGSPRTPRRASARILAFR